MELDELAHDECPYRSLWQRVQLLVLGGEGNFRDSMDVIKHAVGLGAVSLLCVVRCTVVCVHAVCRL